MTLDEIKQDISNYIVMNGNVFDSTKHVVKDVDTILHVKTSYLIYNLAKEEYQTSLSQFGKNRTSTNVNKYLSKTMEKLSVNGEINSYGINKLIHNIINSNGHYEENLSGSDLKYSKFSIFCDEKRDYGISYLRFKFRELGFDIENFDLNQNLSNLKKDGYSTIIIDFSKRKYEKKKNDDSNILYHPQHERLSEYDNLIKESKRNNDSVAENYYRENQKNFLKDNLFEVTPEQFDQMNDDDKKRFYLLKMKESKVLDDEDSYSFWKSNYEMLSMFEKENKASRNNSSKHNK